MLKVEVIRLICTNIDPLAVQCTIVYTPDLAAYSHTGLECSVTGESMTV